MCAPRPERSHHTDKYRTQLPANLTFEQGATIPVGLATAAFGLYSSPAQRLGAGLTPSWEESGRGKYAGQPILLVGGSSAVGQQGQ